MFKKILKFCIGILVIIGITAYLGYQEQKAENRIKELNLLEAVFAGQPRTKELKQEIKEAKKDLEKIKEKDGVDTLIPLYESLKTNKNVSNVTTFSKTIQRAGLHELSRGYLCGIYNNEFTFGLECTYYEGILMGLERFCYI